MPKIAFVGAGRMASALVDGLIAADAAAPARLACFSASGHSARALAQRTGITAVDDLPALLTDADVVIIAFKPHHLSTADSRFAALTRDKLVMSVLAAKTLDDLATVFPHARNLIRTMPNTPSAIGAGITGWCARAALSSSDRKVVGDVLGSIGQALEIPEGKIDALMGVSGCGPAFVFEFTGALRDAGVAAGLDPAEAEKLAIETVLGSARLMARSEQSPESLRDQVTSPQGTTFAGLQVLQAHGFRQIMVEVVAAAQARAAELARSD